MTININTDLVTIFGTLFGIIGVLIAIFQTISARRAKQVYQTFCRDKGKEIVGLTRDITDEVVDACETIDRGFPASSEDDPYPHDIRTVLAAKVNGIRVLTSRLASYCERVNDEHKDKFGEPIFNDINKEIPQRRCLSRVFKELSSSTNAELTPATKIEDKSNTNVQAKEHKTEHSVSHHGFSDDNDDKDDNYQKVTIDHSRNPRNFGALKNASSSVEGSNPSCGDSVKLFAKWTNDVLSEISFEASGCSICKASASVMTEAVKGKHRHEIESLRQHFHGFIKGKKSPQRPGISTDFYTLVEVAKYPYRVRCAILPWRTLKAILDNEVGPVTTE